MHSLLEGSRGGYFTRSASPTPHSAWPYVPFHKLKDANKLLLEAGGADVLSKGPCNPKGGSGYLALNWVFVKELFQGKMGSMPSGAA